MATQRIGGDFDPSSVEAFRNAYAAQLLTPEQQDVDEITGLPTDTVSNTSPWYDHVGLWKYPSGKGPDDDLQKPFNPRDYYAAPEEESEDEDEYTDEEIDALVEEIINRSSEDEEDENETDS